MADANESNENKIKAFSEKIDKKIRREVEIGVILMPYAPMKHGLRLHGVRSFGPCRGWR